MLADVEVRVPRHPSIILRTRELSNWQHEETSNTEAAAQPFLEGKGDRHKHRLNNAYGEGQWTIMMSATTKQTHATVTQHRSLQTTAKRVNFVNFNFYKVHTQKTRRHDQVLFLRMRTHLAN